MDCNSGPADDITSYLTICEALRSMVSGRRVPPSVISVSPAMTVITVIQAAILHIPYKVHATCKRAWYLAHLWRYDCFLGHAKGKGKNVGDGGLVARQRKEKRAAQGIL